MSILFIGQRRPLVNSSIVMSSELQYQQAEKRRKQQIYRQQLLLQIRQKKERGRREKEYYAQVKPRYWPYNHLNTPNIFRKDRPASRSNHYSSEDSSKRHFVNYMDQLKKQSLQNQVNNPMHYQQPSYSSFSPLKFDSYTPLKFDFSHLNRRDGESRLKTESIYDRRTQDNYDWNIEQRKHQLRSYEDKKIEQVYRKMQESVEALNGPTDYSPTIKSRIKELKQERQPLSKSRLRDINENPQESDLYQLPPRLKQSRRKDVLDEEGMSWKERFARLKLKELESQYQSTLIDRQVLEGGERSQTPSFHRKK